MVVAEYSRFHLSTLLLTLSVMNMHTTVAVIGEGITGLAIAYWLQKQNIDVLLLARENEAGGTMKSFNDNGFLYETGANTALETTPLFKELIRDLGLQEEFLYANPSGRYRYILKNNSLLPLPLNPFSFLRTPLFSAQAKLRLFKEVAIGKATKEESVAEFVARRLGKEFLDYAIDPFVAGVFAGKAENLSVQSAFPKLYALEERYGGLIRGMFLGAKERHRRTEKAKDRSATFSFRSGMQVLPRAIARTLGKHILYNAEVLSITTEEKTPATNRNYVIHYKTSDTPLTVTSSAVVLATTAYDAASIVQSLAPSAANVLNSIYYPPIVSLFLGFRQEHIGIPLNGFGFLVPSVEQKNILGCLWNSSLFPGRAPQDMVAINAFVGGSRQPHLCSLTDEKITEMALQDLKKSMQISGKPVYLHITRWEKSIPQYEIGYAKKVEALKETEQQFPGLFFAGNYRGGISVGDCVKNAYELACNIGKQFSQHR